MKTSLLDQALEYHDQLPGIIRATLNDYGLDDLHLDTSMLGWDGKRVTKPLFDCDGFVVEVERYDLDDEARLRRLIEQLMW